MLARSLLNHNGLKEKEISTSSASSKSVLFPEKAAVDITTGYGADSFLYGGTGPQDPWAKDCFMSIVDAATNHREFHYPLPTAYSAKTVDLNALPLSIASLHRAAVLTPITQTTAEQLVVADKPLEAEYANFYQWAAINAQFLRMWLALHFQKEIKKQHKGRMSKKDVQPFIADFWKSQKTTKLASLVGAKPSELRYAFDVMFRGLQYYRILSPNETFYFPHPIRRPLLGGQNATLYEKFSERWSWGRLIANLVETGRIRKEPDEIAQIVASLRVRVGIKEATWYDLAPLVEKEWKDKIITIAGESTLPARVKDKVRKGIERGMGIAGLAADLAPMSAPLVSVGLGVVAIPLSFWKGEVPRALGRLKFCRGVLEWPGLFDNQ